MCGKTCGLRIAAGRNSFLRRQADWLNESMVIFQGLLFLFLFGSFCTRLRAFFALNLWCFQFGFFPALATPTPPRLFAASLVLPGDAVFLSIYNVYEMYI
jgi:hypothetical protein